MILVGLINKSNQRDNYDGYMQELAALVEAAGAEVIATMMQVRSQPDHRTYIGKGKLAELLHLVEESEADIVIFDRELSPGQLRWLDEALPIRVIDRTMLILDIFSRRANSMEGKLQVELATLEYQLPRLIGKGQVLSRTGAGIGTRGMGEQQLELDRRTIRRRIGELKAQLAKVEKTRDLHRKRRIKAGMKSVSLVGYTNAGKSSLFNALCLRGHSSGQDQVEANRRLFQTLDTTTRKIRLSPGNEILLNDTVGFIQDLPPHLVAAFRSTLEEAIGADVILHVIDVSDEAYLAKGEVANQVLLELGADPEQIHTVFNKIDLTTPSDESIGKIPRISALTGQGIPELMGWLEGIIWPEKRMS